MKLRAGFITAAIAAITLISGCSIHPGAAAVIDGERISIDTVDEAAEAHCNRSLAEGAEPLSTVDARRQAIAGIIQVQLAKKLADEAGLELDPAEAKVAPEVRDQIAETFDAADVSGIEKVQERANETRAILTELGEDKTGDESQDAVEVGEKILQEAVNDSDISIDPRFGLQLDEQDEQMGLTGSLSVAQGDEEQRAEQMAKSQQCS